MVGRSVSPSRTKRAAVIASTPRELCAAGIEERQGKTLTGKGIENNLTHVLPRAANIHAQMRDSTTHMIQSSFVGSSLGFERLCICVLGN